MNKIQHLPMVLLCLFTGKLMILNTWSFENAIVLCALAGVVGLFQLKAKNEQIEDLKNVLKEQKESLEGIKKEHEQLKTHVSGIRLAQNMKVSQVQKSF